ncbi:hypothetical protein AEA09_17225 [Lysinibacillus contaminans]|uniref:Uncharacterized protein n=1 Tax=Lysinibacillus contaminans TaxID=1293441 RepID=A0ABR5JX07_9BACI|nr:putative metalloprotease CJM1_0395 family protein [Lysinibacillus contaminans]KOS66487.1 hypothetical protein AEA09_17225 [Lysinibacillus contaminans]
MKISGLIQQERIAALEDRRKILQRKGVGDVYRKNLQYFQPKKNPALIELENLLFGHKDHDLYEKHKEESKEVTHQEQATIREMQQTEKSVRAHEQAHKAVGGDVTGPISYTHTTGPEGERYITGGEVSITAGAGSTEEETLQILEKVRSAALAPVDPSPQDLRVAASAGEQIQQVQAKLNGTEIEETNDLDEEPAFVREPIEIKVPERFSKELKLDPFADTIFGRSYEESYMANIFKHVAAKYTAHSEMAKNGYLPRYEPTFSWTA